MDGIHDLGGKEGFGRVDRTGEDEAYHSEADARAYAMTVSLRAERAFPIDWFRHVREQIEPVDYLTRPYFDQWLQTTLAMSIDAGDVTLEEVRAGNAQALARPASPMTVEQVEAALTSPVDFSRDGGAPAAFAVGDAARCIAEGHQGHIRLPAYARGRRGTIHDFRGHHLVPDEGARGVHLAEPLYTVGFEAGELWPEAAGRKEMVFLDLWERYLERA